MARHPEADLVVQLVDSPEQADLLAQVIGATPGGGEGGAVDQVAGVDPDGTGNVPAAGLAGALDGLLIPQTDKGVPNGVATLGGDGFVPSSQLAAFELSTFEGEVADEAAMLAVVGADAGSYVIRLDTATPWFLVEAPASTLGNWVQLTAAGAITSVNGQVGVVVLTKSDLGLGAVQNTADADKPVSTAQAAAIGAVQADADAAGSLAADAADAADAAGTLATAAGAAASAAQGDATAALARVPDPSGEDDDRMLAVAAGALVYVDPPEGGGAVATVAEVAPVLGDIPVADLAAALLPFFGGNGTVISRRVALSSETTGGIAQEQWGTEEAVFDRSWFAGAVTIEAHLQGFVTDVDPNDFLSITLQASWDAGATWTADPGNIMAISQSNPGRTETADDRHPVSDFGLWTNKTPTGTAATSIQVRAMVTNPGGAGQTPIIGGDLLVTVRDANPNDSQGP
jgi:hypothetical protein